MFQAQHQHFYDFEPPSWFIHFRRRGDGTAIVQGLKSALDATSTPFPQTLPSNPTTSLPANAMGKILGASPNIGSDGVVNFDIPREDSLYLGEMRVSPYLNVQTSVSFEPLGSGRAAAAPDFGKVTAEVEAVTRVMRSQGWDVGCLYNQETGEHPQLSFPTSSRREIRYN